MLEPPLVPVPRLRWGVLSTAGIGRRSVNPAIQASRNGTLDAIASRDEARARAVAAELGIARAVGSYDALLDDPAIDAVFIPLPNSMHREWSIKAANAGKHVLCEKPLALSAAECREMQAAATANGTLLMEAFMYRFHPRTERLVAMARAGAFGALRSIRSVFTFRLASDENIRMKPELGGGALMDVGCYCVNASRTIAGAEPVEVQAWASWAATGVDAELAGSMRFADGLVAHFDCALTLDRRELVEVAGTDASVTVDGAFVGGKDRQTFLERRARERTVHEVDGADQYQLMVEHFADCVLHRRPLRYAAAEAGANMRVIEALYRSARDGGRPVALD